MLSLWKNTTRYGSIDRSRDQESICWEFRSQSESNGVDYATVRRIQEQLMQTTAYMEVNASQHNRYNAAIVKYLLYLRDSGCPEFSEPVCSIRKASTQKDPAFDTLFEEEKFGPLYKEWLYVNSWGRDKTQIIGLCRRETLRHDFYV